MNSPPIIVVKLTCFSLIVNEIIDMDVEAIKGFKNLLDRCEIEDVIYFSEKIARKNQFLDFLNDIVYGDLDSQF